MITLSIVGGIAILSPCDKNTQKWCAKNLQNGFQPDAPHFFYIEMRFLQDILEAIKSVGFTVKSE